MKKLFFYAFVFLFASIQLLHASDGGVADTGGDILAIAEWDSGAAVLKLHGVPAKELYRDLKAIEKLDQTYQNDAFALKNHERFLKKNSFADCKALKEKVTIGGDATGMIMKSVSCSLQAPANSVN